MLLVILITRIKIGFIFELSKPHKSESTIMIILLKKNYTFSLFNIQVLIKNFDIFYMTFSFEFCY